ncbi:MAG: MFS transporter [Bifidobacteriaceae bacterium]|jgi:GPH family glycoside/pentoside/hexuronide:cation symporter|nr:MFS transporter [Bifidobacteriaceae bacterium]
MKRLSTGKLIMIAVGTSGPGLMTSSFGLYTLRFFAPTEEVGLPLLIPIGWIGIIQGLSLLFDFLIDPVVASWGDNSKNPKGRRIPMMRRALLPAVVFAILVFFAPVPTVSWFNALWVLVMFLAYSFTRSVYDINLQALIPEVVADSHRRLRVFAIRTAVGLAGTMVLSLVPGLVEGMRAGGAEPIAAWRILLSVFPLAALLLMLPPALFIRETDFAPANPPEQERTPLFKGLREILGVRPFLMLVTGAVLLSFAASVTTTTLQFYVDVLFGMKGGMSSFFLILMIVVSFLFYPPVLMVSRRIGKKKLMLASVVVCAAAYLLLYFYKPVGKLLGTAPVGEFWAGLAGEGAMSGYVNLMLILALILGFPITSINLLLHATFTDITQYHTIRTGRTRAGIFAAAQSIMLAIPGTLIPAVVGLLIYLGSTNDLPTVAGVRATALVALIVCVPAFIFYKLYDEKEVAGTIRAFVSGEGGPDGAPAPSGEAPDESEAPMGGEAGDELPALAPADAPAPEGPPSA